MSVGQCPGEDGTALRQSTFLPVTSPDIHWS